MSLIISDEFPNDVWIVLAQNAVGSQPFLSLRHFAQKKNRLSQIVAFLLVAPPVADDELRVRDQPDEPEVVVSLAELDTRRVLKRFE